VDKEKKEVGFKKPSIGKLDLGTKSDFGRTLG